MSLPLKEKFVYPQVYATANALSREAAQASIKLVVAKVPMRPDGYNDGCNPYDGMLGVARWHLPRLWQSVMKNEYDVQIVRYDDQLNYSAHDQIAATLERLYAHGQSIWFDILEGDSVACPPQASEEFRAAGGYTRSDLPGARATSVFATVLGLSSTYLSQRSAPECAGHLQERLDRTGLKIQLDEMEFPPWGGPVAWHDSGLAVRIGREHNDAGELVMRDVTISGIKSMADAIDLARRTVEVSNGRLQFSWAGSSIFYESLRERLNALFSGWGVHYLGRRRKDIDPYDDRLSYDSEVARWIPMVEWNRKICPGTRTDNIVCAILRCDDGLRLEFSSSCRSSELLIREIQQVAGPVVLIPIEPGSEFDVE